MKKFSILVIPLLIIFSTSLTLAASFSSFKGGRMYSGEGRWYKNGDTYLFRINEGNAQEENISFSKNSLRLDHQLKYKLCFKIAEDCQLDCKADLIREVSVIKPWVEAQVWVPNADGSYPFVTESACK